LDNFQHYVFTKQLSFCYHFLPPYYNLPTSIRNPIQFFLPIILINLNSGKNPESLTHCGQKFTIYNKHYISEGWINMGVTYPTRAEAFELLKKYNSNESLIRHALAVEAVMRHFAELFGEPDVEKWAIIGLVHDLDYEMYPDQHCQKVREILMDEGWPEDYIRAIQSHGWGICSDVEPVEKMEKVLYTIDELTGLIAATALLRPSKSILDLKAKSVKKKWNQKSFAAGVNREIIEKGLELLGMERDFIIEETIKGMQKVAEEIGLKGNL
jgi:predicted hydrolase (HD superfamily)